MEVAISDVTDSQFEEEVIRSDRVRVFKMDLDANPQTPHRYNVRAVPTLLFFKNGEVADQLVGAVPKARIVEKLQGLS
jgi:thioredoxin 1